ncbi:uncharacterized protein [Spinacia oleracea]|uniref:Uncharacterized protein isoform X2 n=1 Tax=Spinacia oleracea TaxID=3562 RepID=A0ABM3REA3_SPIOL|nr:uncharacterized protein LOC110791819 isoform X2 [Spinacia oleracea]
MSIHFEARACGGGWSEKYDCIPLRLRRKMLHSVEHPKEDDGYLNAKTICGYVAGNVNGKQLIAIENCSSTALCTNASEVPIHQSSDSGQNILSSGNSSSDHSVDCSGDSDLDIKFENSSVCSNKLPASKARAENEQLNNHVGVFRHPTTSDVLDNVLQDRLMGCSSANGQVIEVKHEKLYEFDDALDNVLIKERRKMLASRKLMQSPRSHVEVKNNGGLSNLSKISLRSAKSNSIPDALIGKHLNLKVNSSNDLSSEFATDGTSHTANRCSRPLPVSASTQETAMMDACPLASSVLPSLAKVKDEPLDINELCSEGKNTMQNSGQTLTVKKEPGFSEFLVDELDHLPLVDRVKLLSSGIPTSDLSGNPEFFKEDEASALDFGNAVLESVKPISISRTRKKRRTATDSVETALEEDAPGLLKVLLDRGVSPEEIKLYGEEDTDDILDDSLSEDRFTELEAVISQLFSQRQTFLKFPLLRSKGEKISYCLSCLFSLVEQTRYLRNRKWPVEWGWCRDLQSFIFVFQRHNRIVLERPEYGYATYFFELLNSVPVAWQVKRLVTAMKLTNCGRITLLENRPLVQSLWSALCCLLLLVRRSS